MIGFLEEIFARPHHACPVNYLQAKTSIMLYLIYQHCTVFTGIIVDAYFFQLFVVIKVSTLLDHVVIIITFSNQFFYGSQFLFVAKKNCSQFFSNLGSDWLKMKHMLKVTNQNTKAELGKF